METTTYAFKKTLHISHSEAVLKVTEELKKEGFGVLTEIDVQATLKSKLNADIRKYRILGACNPPSAFKAISTEPDIGLMLPCNVVVYENEHNAVVVAAIDPVASMMAVENRDLESTAQDIRSRLSRVIEAL
jgi:uncharacterized protein (DUF302 family)